jgi:hypothetical protein
MDVAMINIKDRGIHTTLATNYTTAIIAATIATKISTS